MSRYYIMSATNLDDLGEINSQGFKKIHPQHWNIECVHRLVKPVCYIEDFQERNTQAVVNHLQSALLVFILQQCLLKIK